MEKGEVMKNGNGTGNIYKMKDKSRKPRAVRVTTRYTLDCKQIRKYIETYETKREEQESLFEYLKNPKLYKKITFKEITDLWFESYKKKKNLEKLWSYSINFFAYLSPINKKVVKYI